MNHTSVRIFKIKVARQDDVAISIQTSYFSPTESGNSRLVASIILKNRGCNSFNGKLTLSTDFYQHSEDILLEIGAEQTYIREINLEHVQPGQYELRADVTKLQGKISSASAPFEVQDALFIVIPKNSDMTYVAGQEAVMEFEIKNTGSKGGLAEFQVSLLDLLEGTRSNWLEPGQSQLYSFIFNLPEDISDGDYKIIYKLNGSPGECRFYVRGYQVQVLAELNKSVYEVGDTMALRMKVVNDTYETVYLPVTVFFDNMEDGILKWQQISSWGLTDTTAKSPSNCFTDSPSGNYQNNADTSLVTIPISLTGLKEATLSFWHKYALESPWDYSYVEISDNLGQSWKRLKSYTGFKNDWAEEKIELADYDGKTVLIRFRLTSDNSVTYDGWYVDDVKIEALQPEKRYTGFDIIGKARYSDTEIDYSARLHDEQVFEFNFPVSQNDDEKIYYEVCLNSGKSLYLSSKFVQLKDPVINIFTDKQFYNSGDKVRVYVEPSNSGLLSLNAPGYSRNLEVNEPFDFEFTLPADLTTGTYAIDYNFNGKTGDYKFNVKGHSCKILEFKTDKSVYRPNDLIAVTCKFSLEQSARGVIKGWSVDKEGVYKELFEYSDDFDIGENTVATNALFSAEIPGIHKLVYGIYLQDPQNLLASGSELFEVKDAGIVEISSREVYPVEEDVKFSVLTKALTPTIIELVTLKDGNVVDERNLILNGEQSFDVNLGSLLPGKYNIMIRLKGTEEILDSAEFKLSVQDKQAPQPPKGLILSNISGSTVILSWESNSENDLAWYNVYENGIMISALPASLSSYTRNNLAANIIYRYYLTAVDKGGNESLPSESIEVITDNIPPVLTLSPSSDTVSQEPLILTYEAKDNLDPAPQVYGNYPSPTTFNRNGIYQVIVSAIDSFGNKTTKSITITINLPDDKPPVTTINIGNPKFSADPVFVTGSTLFTFDAIDDLSGVDQIEYQINDSGWNIYKTPFALPEPGPYTIIYRSIDKAGNIEEAKILTVLVDNQAPISRLASSPEMYESEGQYYASPKYQFNLLAQDEGAGLKAIYFNLDGLGYRKYEDGINITGEGAHLISYYAVDNLENQESIKSQTVQIDATTPETELIIKGPVSHGNQTIVNGTTLFELSSKDIGSMASGVKTTYYRVNAGEWSIYEKPFVLNDYNDGEIQISFFSEDNVGNCETLKEVKVVLDKTPPVARIDSPCDLQGISHCLYIADTGRSSIKKYNLGKYTIINGMVNIYGTIDDVNLQGWKLEYGLSEDPQSWSMLTQGGATSVTENQLSVWDTRRLTGIYTLRLTASDIIGNQKQMKVTVKIGEPDLVLEFQDAPFIHDIMNSDKECLDKVEHNHMLPFFKNLKLPVAIAVDEAGRVFVADKLTHRVIVYDSSGKYLTTYDLHSNSPFPNKDRLMFPTGIAVDRFKNLYIADTLNHCIRKLDDKGNLVLTIGKKSHGIPLPGAFNQPTDVAVDKDGKIYVADSGNNRIQVFDPDGKFLFQFGSKTLPDPKGPQPGTFNQPYGIAVDDYGRIIVTDRKNDRIQVFDLTGKYLFMIGGKRSAQSKLHISCITSQSILKLPSDLFVDFNGKIYVANTLYNKISVFDRFGNLLMEFGVKGISSQFLFPEGIALGPGFVDFEKAPDQYADLAIYSPDIGINHGENNTIKISANIYNHGVDAYNVKVRLFDDNPVRGGSQIGEDKYILKVTAKRPEIVEFVLDRNQLLNLSNLYIIVDPGNAIPEVNEDNNAGYIQIDLSSF